MKPEDFDDDPNNWTRQQLRSVPERKWNEDIGTFDCLIILPTKRKHDSDYACMEFVAVKGGKPIYIMGGCSDVIHLDGIGGLDKNWNVMLDKVKPTGWCIDCLLKSGLLRIFTNKPLSPGLDLSSFELYSD